MRTRRIPMNPRSQRVNDVAGVSETIDFYATTPGNTQTNNFLTFNRSVVSQVYTSSDIQLSDFLRAKAVAANYQQYRIKYVEISFLPDADTFAVGAQSGKPYLYYQVDKASAIPTTATNISLKTTGCQPIALDEKPINIRFKPAALLAVNYQSGTSTSSTTAGMYKVSPLLTTNSVPGNTSWAANDVAHQGIKFFAENNGAALNFSGKITAHFEFRKPLIQEPPQNVDVSGNPVH